MVSQWQWRPLLVHDYLEKKEWNVISHLHRKAIIPTYTVSTAAQLGSTLDGTGDIFSGRNGNATSRDRG